MTTSFTIQIADLANNVFTAPVCAVLPTKQTDEEGKNVPAYLHFIGTFRSQSVEETKKASEELERADGDVEKLHALLERQTAEILVGFSKHPKHPFPFKQGESDLADTPENIKLILNSPEVRKAVKEAYNAARDQKVDSKNLKK